MKHISDQALANCLRFLAVDAIDQAQSGHPGMPLGMADVMTVLVRERLKHEPMVPTWPDRDRMVLSNGHGSMLLYAALYLSGYDWSIEELKQFRQLHSSAAGHPEHEIEKGIEATTGPLGQGIAMALGMAVANAHQGLPGRVYCFVGDGCLMEGISHEACSLAPHLVGGQLVLLWDDNGISIDGHVDQWMEKDVCQRFKSYGFEVIEAVDAHDFDAIRTAFDQVDRADKPCLIQFKSIIGKGCSDVEGSEKAHGQPLSKAAIQVMREDLNWSHVPFDIPKAYLDAWDMKNTHPDAKAAEQLKPYLLDEFVPSDKAMSTRQASQLVIQQYVAKYAGVIGGSADLAASTLTKMGDYLTRENPSAKDIAYGVREFAMFSIANGLALGGLLPFVSTFLVFMDYGKNALRLSALMRLRVAYVLTHDSVFLGEDGPTHQPIEQLATCRAMPNVELWRPANLQETYVAWQAALERLDGPTVLALSRQSLPSFEVDSSQDISQGGYLVKQSKAPVLTLIATGSEVALANELADKLAEEEIDVDVISVPCWDRFMSNGLERIIRTGPKARIVIEAASSLPWLGLVEDKKQIVSIDTFGVSAPKQEIAKYFGFDVMSLYTKVKDDILSDL